VSHRHGNGPIGLWATYRHKRTLGNMKGTLTAAALIGALAAGGLPALALGLTGAQTAPQSDAQGDAAVVGVVPAAGDAGDAGDAGEGDDDAQDDTGTPGWARHEQRVPPGWAKNHKGATPFGWQMRSWARCVGDNTPPRVSEDDQDTPSAKCGAKPRPPHRNAVPPGHAKSHEKPAKPAKPGRPQS
jgi:hypothetical protein